MRSHGYANRCQTHGCSWSPARASIPGCCRTSRAWTSAASVPDLFKHLACADVAVVQGALSTTMELVATGRPFIYFPLPSPLGTAALRHPPARPLPGRPADGLRDHHSRPCWPPRCGPHWHKLVPDPVTGKVPRGGADRAAARHRHTAAGQWPNDDRPSSDRAPAQLSRSGRLVDEGWGRKCGGLRHAQRAGQLPGVRRRCTTGSASMPETGCSDVACGSGLAIELARLRGASCCRHRRLGPAGRGGQGPELRTADIRTGDMHALPGIRARSTW